MTIRPYAYVLITFLVFSWKCGKASGSESTMKTWKEAVSDCYGNNSFLESNITVLQKYMLNHNKVNNSIWVGSFEALLPWIEIRGCYNIPLTDNSLEMDETNAANVQLCQLKCMNRRYFAFNIKNMRCVCFDDIVNKETDNASYCQELIDRGDCNTHAVVYKVFNRPITLAGNNHDCLSYQCDSSDSMPIFSTKECFTNSRSYCRDGRRADGPDYQHFLQHRGNCEERHFTYPLLYSENPVKLCNVSESLSPGIDVWVGVYRQRLYMDNSDKAVIQDLEQIEQFISRCDYLPANAAFFQAENCSGKHHYKCTSDTPIESQKELHVYNSSTASHSCGAEDPGTGETDNQSSGTIIGIAMSISVIVLTILVILAFVYRRKYTKEPLFFNTDCRRDSHTNEIDNYALHSDYQQLDTVQEKPKAYDQLQVRCNHGNVDTELTTEQTNTSFSRDEYSNTEILEYEQLDNADKDTNTHAYDQLNVTRIVKTDSTNFFSNTTVSKEKYSKNESTRATNVTLEYEQLDIAKRDKSVNVYDQLHVTDMIDNEQNNYNSMILRDQQEETTNLNRMTVTSEYEQFDSAKKDKSVNVYDQLDVANVLSNDPTPHNPCQ